MPEPETWAPVACAMVSGAATVILAPPLPPAVEATTAVSWFAPLSMVMVWPAIKSATLATLMLVAPAAEAAGKLVAGCNRKSVQLLSVSTPSGKRPALLLIATAAAPGRPKPPAAPGVGTRQPLCPAPEIA